MKLLNQTKNQEIASDVEVASTYLSRLVGLLGRRGMEQGHALWIKSGNSIHTWFMMFAIDVVFVDKNLVVRAIHQNVKPWRMTSPFLKADSVFEMPAGTLQNRALELGDQLHVGG